MSGEKEPAVVDPTATFTIGDNGDGRMKVVVATKFADVIVLMSPEQAIGVASTIVNTAGRIAVAAAGARGLGT